VTDWSDTDLPLPEKVQLLKTMVDIVEVAELLGFEPDSNGKIPSPFNPDERTPSCHLYEPDHWFDFSTGRGGDCIDLVQALQEGCTWGKAVHLLWTRGLRAGFEPGRHTAVAKPEPADLWAAWTALPCSTYAPEAWASQLGLPADALNDLADAGLVKCTAADMFVPHWHPDEDGKPRVRGIKTRALTGAKGSVTGSQYTHGLYEGMYVDHRQPVAVICEGESDCWALSWHWKDDPVDVFALPGGAGLWRDEWLETLASYQSIWLAFDNDQAGRQATDKVTRAIGWGRANRLQLPGFVNDVREAYVQGWRPRVPV
jgi:hypothetical protein